MSDINERVDVVNDNLILIQDASGLTFGTDALLLAAYLPKYPKWSGLELGAGSGIISLLLATRDKLGVIDTLEIQEPSYELILRNIEKNNLGNKVSAHLGDVRTPPISLKESYDVVFSNPPYMVLDGPKCKSDEKQIARHEVHGTIYDFVSCAASKLKYGGKFYVVYRQDRMTDLFSALSKYKLEPKRMTFVHAKISSAPSMILLEAKKGAKPGLKVTKPLIIGSNIEERCDSEDMTYILNEGSFPKAYE